MPDITKAEIWIAALKVVFDAPQVVIPLLFLVAGFVWWFRGIITQAKIEALGAQNTTLTERLKLAEDRETDVRQKMDALEKTVKELTAAEKTPTQLATSTAKVAAALKEVRSANTAVHDILKAGTVSFRPDSPPNLTFTSPKRIVLEGIPFTDKSKIYWNPLLFETVRKAATALGRDRLKTLLDVNNVDGVGMQDKGYHYIEEGDLSVQGQDANRCWAQIFKLAKGANLTLEVEFVWQDTPKAAHPGLVGKFYVGSASNTG